MKEQNPLYIDTQRHCNEALLQILRLKQTEPVLFQSGIGWYHFTERSTDLGVAECGAPSIVIFTADSGKYLRRLNRGRTEAAFHGKESTLWSQCILVEDMRARGVVVVAEKSLRQEYDTTQLRCKYLSLRYVHIGIRLVQRLLL